MTRLARSLVIGAALFSLLGGREAAHAQEGGPPFALIKPPFECRNFRGVKVVVQEASGLGDVARAQIVGRIPFIQVDPERLASLPPKLQMFFFGHECAHHVLGHNFYLTPTVEVDADCWSIKKGRLLGLYSREDVVGFDPYIAPSKGSSVGHLPGPERLKRMLACFDDPDEFAATQ